MANHIAAQLLEILVCPLCKGKLFYHQTKQELICRADRLAFPIQHHIPIMLLSKARSLTLEELPQ